MVNINLTMFNSTMWRPASIPRIVKQVYISALHCSFMRNTNACGSTLLWSWHRYWNGCLTGAVSSLPAYSLVQILPTYSIETTGDKDVWLLTSLNLDLPDVIAFRLVWALLQVGGMGGGVGGLNYSWQSHWSAPSDGFIIRFGQVI